MSVQWFGLGSHGNDLFNIAGLVQLRGALIDDCRANARTVGYSEAISLNGREDAVAAQSEKLKTAPTINSGSGMLISFPEVGFSMQRAIANKTTANVLRVLLAAVLLFCLALCGCGDACFSGFFNGNDGGAMIGNSSCTLNKANGTVIMHMSAASAVSAHFSSSLEAPSASQLTPTRDVQHIFVTLRGIEAHPSTTAGEDSSTWQQLAPELTAHPMQLDLLAPLTPAAPLELSAFSDDSTSLNLRASVTATIPADEYRQLRLHVVPLHPSPDDPLPESNACGNVGWNCIVFGDRSVHPLEFDGAAAEFHITSEHATDSFFRVLPDEVIQLSIEFDPASSVFFASNAAVRLIPVFRVVSRSSAPAASAQ
jgi:hypothetical protein